jgi:biopolymer transport protein ExbD
MLLTRTRRPAAVNGVAKPQLTSLVDMLTILLVFLLKSFSVEGNLVSASEDLVLPQSTSIEMPTPMVNVEITAAGVILGEKQIADLAAVVDQDSLLIKPLYDELRLIAETTGVADRENEIMIQCDRGLGFQIIKKVMYSCSQASFSDFSLLVVQED